MNDTAALTGIVVIACFTAGYLLVSYVWKKLFSRPLSEKTSHRSEKDDVGGSGQPGGGQSQCGQESKRSAGEDAWSASHQDAGDDTEDDTRATMFDDTDTEKYYASILGLEGRVSRGDIRKRYLQMASQYHPDKVYHLGPRLRQVAEEEMKRINEAYQFFRSRYSI